MLRNSRVFLRCTAPIYFSQIATHTLAGVSYCASLKSTGKFRSWRMQRRVKCRNPSSWDRSRHVWSPRWKQNFMATLTLQNSLELPQSVGFSSLTHHSMRQDQIFPAHFELAPYDTPASVWNTFSEIGNELSDSLRDMFAVSFTSFFEVYSRFFIPLGCLVRHFGLLLSFTPNWQGSRQKEISEQAHSFPCQTEKSKMQISAKNTENAIWKYPKVTLVV